MSPISPPEGGRRTVGRAVSALLTAAALLLLVLGPVTGGASAAVRTFRGDVDHHASYDFEVPGDVILMWTFTAEDQVQSSPMPYEDLVIFGSDDGNIYAVDHLWGREVWRVETGGPVMSSPTLSDDGLLFIGSADRVLRVLDPSTGDEAWRFTVPDIFGQIISSTALDDQRAYFGASDWRVYAVNLTTHEEDWNFTTGNEVWGSPALWGDRLYVGSLDGDVYCLWKENGTLAWNFSTASWEGVYSSPAIADGKVVFGSTMGDEAVYALDAVTGDVVWRFDSGGPSYSSPAFDEENGTIFVSAWGPPGRLYALPIDDPTPGDGVLEQEAVLWSGFTGDEQGGSSPVLSRGRVVVGSDFGMGGEGRIFCFEVDTGEEVWNYSTGGDVYSTPAVSEGQVMIGSIDGRVYALMSSSAGGGLMEVTATPELDVIQGGRVMGIDFLVTYRGFPLEGAFVKVTASDGELSQAGASTFPDGTQRVKYQAPDVKTETTVTFKVESTFFGIDPANTTESITIVPASDYMVESSTSFPVMKYLAYLILMVVLVVANVAVAVMLRKVGKDKGVGNAP